MEENRVCFLSGNMLKVIAAVAMLIDHVGLMFFPDIIIFRIIGRLAFPIFAYMIAEGCRYTKNRFRYFSTIFVLAIICQIVYYFADDGNLYMCILVTFSLAILVIYALQNFKRELLKQEKSIQKCVINFVVLVCVIWSVWMLNKYFEIDYGFFGSMVPVFSSLLQPVDKNDSSVLKTIDSVTLHVTMLGIGLVLQSASSPGMEMQLYALCALPILLMYSGKRGKRNMKYFFYVFYPVHLALLQGIYMLIG